MKKIDYYAVQHPWRMPKWLGATLGAIFGFILIVSGVAIVKLTRPPVTAVAAALPSPTVPAATTAPAAAVVAPAQPTAVAPVAAPAAEVAQADASTGKHHGKHHASSSSKHAVSARIAAKHNIKGAGVVMANAKHDNRKLKEKDALDKLLGI